MLEGGVNVLRLTIETPGGVHITRGGGCTGGAMLRRIFELSEPAWETGDDRANLEGSQGCSNLVPALYLVGGCTRRMYKPAVAVFWREGGCWSTAGDVMRNW